jgi:hypothetical protein
MSNILENWRNISKDKIGSFQEPGPLVWDSLLEFQTSKNIVGNFFEIGVLHGKSASLSALYAHKNNTHQVLVDPAEYVNDAVKWITQIMPGIDVRFINDVSDNVHGYPALYEPKSYSWFHIDGKHTYQQCFTDIVLANNCLSETGVVIIDDFFSPVFPQVTASTFSYLEKYPNTLKIFLVGPCNKAYLCRPSAHDLYKQFCVDILPKGMEDRGCPIMLCKTTPAKDFDCFGYQPASWNLENTPFRGPDWDQGNITDYI